MSALQARSTGPLLRALVGPAPCQGSVLFVARAAPPEDGTGRGTWIQAACPDADRAARLLSEGAEQGDSYAALAWFAPGLGRTRRAVRAKRTASADIDALRMPGASPQERAVQAAELARSLPCPVVIVASGGGCHVHVLLPVTERVEHFADPDEGVARAELLARALRLCLEDRARALFGAVVELDPCQGAERVWRVPPGWNAKSADGARTLTADRSRWRPVTLEVPADPEGLASIAPADLTFLGPFLDAAANEQEGKGPRPACAPATPAGAEGRNQACDGAGVAVAAGSGAHFEPRILPDRLHEKWPMREGDQSDHDFAVASALAKGGWFPGTARAAIAMRRRLLADPEDQSKGERGDYLDRTLRKVYGTLPRPEVPQGLRPFVPFPVGVLPPVLRDFVVSGARVIGCALEAILLPLLCVLGAAIGNTRRIGLKRRWSEPALLWAAVVLPSGAKKSPALDVAVGVLDRRQEQALRRFKEELGRHLGEQQQHLAVLSDWRRAGDGRSSKPPEAPVRPVAARFKVSDTTIEALAPILEENARGVLLVRDELAAWLKSFDAYKQGRGGDREQWLTVHRAGSILVDRKQDRSVISVPRAFVGVCGGIQPRTLKRVLSDEFFECGLPARLLMAMPPSPRRKWNDDEIDQDTEAGMAQAQERLYGLRFCRLQDDEMGPSVMWLSSGAKRLWVEFHDAFAGEQEGLEEEDDLGAAFAKLEGYAARFALILCLMRWAEGADAQAPDLVDEESMRGGIEMARWFAQETERVYARFRETEPQARQRRLVTWIRAQRRPVTVRSVQRGLREYREDARAAEAALADLGTAHLGWRVLLPPPRTGGTSVHAFVLREDLLAAGDGDTCSSEGPSDAGSTEQVSPEDPPGEGEAS